MKTITTFTLAAVAAASGLLGTRELSAESKAPAVQLSPEQFQNLLRKDMAPPARRGQLQMSYANVVDKILPSVVTVFSYGERAGRAMRGGQEMPDLDQLPPMFREILPGVVSTAARRWGGGEPPPNPAQSAWNQTADA